MSDAAFILQVGGHDTDIKDGKVECTHINDGIGEDAHPGSGVQDAKKGLTEEQLEKMENTKH